MFTTDPMSLSEGYIPALCVCVCVCVCVCESKSSTVFIHKNITCKSVAQSAAEDVCNTRLYTDHMAFT